MKPLRPEENTFGIINIQTTYKCQMQCANCYLGNMLNNPKFSDIDPIRFEDTLARLPERVEVRLIGAEPTMYRRLPDLIQIIRKCGHRPSLLTNGLKLRKETYVKHLKDAGLFMLGLSMNGGLDDTLYQRFDNGKYAKQKMIALENCFKYRIVPHINIIVDPTNAHVVRDIQQYVIELSKKYGVKLGPKFPVYLRIKSIGKMGTHMISHTYNLDELVNIMEKVSGTTLNRDYHMYGTKETNTCIFNWPVDTGTMYGKCTDWTVDDDGLPDAGSSRRGILTHEYMIEPFFEYYGDIDETRETRVERKKHRTAA